ncbi:hypothetical protein MHU86_12185 [Fragilaria crotonensis]|nr:hypothetical protein MHU86_13201 [Fragilaria crotonensis]KAI2502296.1 hypothetical protein MHU86_12185 [Fragilaria crotonensis]
MLSVPLLLVLIFPRRITKELSTHGKQTAGTTRTTPIDPKEQRRDRKEREKADQLNKTMRENKKQDSQQLPLGRNVTDNEVEQETQHVFGNNRHDLNEKESTTPWNNTTTQTAPHPNIPTNDGTHRVTIKWFPPEDLAVYESDKNKMNEAIYNLVSDILPNNTECCTGGKAKI